LPEGQPKNSRVNKTSAIAGDEEKLRVLDENIAKNHGIHDDCCHGYSNDDQPFIVKPEYFL
jgi:hypothetical protein